MAINTISATGPHRQSHHTYSITRANMSHIHTLLEGGEVLDMILQLLEETASNAAIMQLTSTNSMLGRHREDFRIRAKKIIQSRRT